MRRINPYANISLDLPEMPQAPQPMNWMQFNHPTLEEPDTGGQIAGLGQSILGLKRKFGSKQKGAIDGALRGGMSGGFEI